MKGQKMKNNFAIWLFVSLIGSNAFAHAGHIHTYMGTVTKLHGNAFSMTTTKGAELTVATSKQTAYLEAGGGPARRAELRPGERVVVKMTIDGKTAASVRMSAPKGKRR
jgi:hypothetical protein